jgi:phospholipid N-methyltransferase
MKFWFLNLLGDFGTKITSNTAIIDFGCGNGSVVKSLLDSGFNNYLSGIEILNSFQKKMDLKMFVMLKICF